MAGHQDPPEFSVAGAGGEAVATFTITTEGTVNSASEVVADMVTGMIEARNWTPEQAAAAFSAGWSNGYLSIRPPGAMIRSDLQDGHT
jgi:hypothetical protein